MVHTLLQANGTPGLQMLESNVMVCVHLPRHPLPSLTLLLDLPFMGKDDNMK